MAVDVVVNPDAGCISIVHDEGAGRAAECVTIEDGVLFVVKGGETSMVGRLTERMAMAAAECRTAVVVAMDGPRVAWCRRIRLVIDGVEA